MKIGFIGLGNLGTPIADNILEATQQLFVYNRTVEKAKTLAEKGAVICNSVKELAEKSDIVFTIVSDDMALKHITSGPGGVAANLKAGGVHISMSTILPATASELSQLHQSHKNHYVAAPVMGRPEAARAKKINFLVSGEAEILHQVKPLLIVAGAAGVWEFGSEAAQANVAKLCSNFLIIAAIEAMAEGINLAGKSGIDASSWMNMLTQTIFSSPLYINYGNILLKEAYLPAAFSLRLGLKDVKLVNEQAATAHIDMPFGNLLEQRLTESVNRGLGEHDWTAIALSLK